jgi:hypothetical protein
LKLARTPGRLALGPVVGLLAVSMLVAVELSRYGLLVAVAGAALVFALAEAVILAWGRYQLRSARRRLEKVRARRQRARGRDEASVRSRG